MKSGPLRLVFEHALVALAVGVCGVQAGCVPAAGAGGGDEGATGPVSDEGGSGDDRSTPDDGAPVTVDASDNVVGFMGQNLNPDEDSSGPTFDGNTGELTISQIGTPVQISGQFLFTEGPIWDPKKQVLYFSDINGNEIYQLTLPDTITTFLMPSQNANGLGLDPQGQLIVAGFRSRTIERVVGTSLNTIASTYQSKKLNSPDDIIARSDGVIYFTDPAFGIDGSQGFTAETQELSFQGVFRLTTDGTLHLEDQSMTTPNGVELSPDEHSLYVSFTTPGTIQKYSVAADGSLGTPVLFASGVTGADSMCVDTQGNLYVASVGGIAIFTPSGSRIGTIAMTQIPTNCAFGGPDQKTLFITAHTAGTGTPTAGNAALLRIDHMPIPGLPGRP